MKFLRNSATIWLAFVLFWALLPRIYVAFRWAPYLRPDSIEYLKLGRILRGKCRQDDWGWRTPGYPIFNLVFALTGWRGTSDRLLIRVVQQWTQVRPNSQIPAWHLRYLKAEEDLKSVQVAQHGLGLLAVGLMFQLFWRLSSNLVLAAFGALVSIGWNPYWWFYERSILTEALTATLLMAFFHMLKKVEDEGWKPQQLAIVALIGSIVALIRPQFVLTTPMLFAWWLWKVLRREVKLNWQSLVASTLPFLILVGGWTVRNGIRYGYWGLSTVVGFNLCMHFTSTKDFDAFPDPFLQEALRKRSEKCPYPWVIRHVYPELVAEWHLPLPAITKRLEEQAIAAIVRHPQTFLISVLKALAAFFRLLPPEYFMFPVYFWFPFALLSIAGLLTVLFMPRFFTPYIRFVALFVVITALLTAVTAGGASPTRYGFPTDTLLMLLSLVAGWQIWCYRRGTRENLPKN